MWLHDRDFRHFDLYQSSSSEARPLLPAYSTLVQYDQLDVDKLLPDLAERWDISSNALVYTFQLRKDVKFHDGMPLTSRDVKFSLDRLYKPVKAGDSIYTDWLQMVDRVEATDDHTVKVTLKTPASHFLGVLGLGFTGIIPKHIAEAKGDMKRDIIGTGPFKLKEHKPGVSLEYTKNENYYLKDRPYLDGVKFVIVKDEATRFGTFRTGQAHITPIGGAGLTPDQAEQAEKTMTDKVTVYRHADLSLEKVTVNTTRKPFDDVRVRKALHLAFDRQAYRQTVYGNAFTLTGFIVPETWAIPRAELLGQPGYKQPKDADRAEARRLLADAGFPNGFETKILVQSQGAEVRRGEFLQAQFATIGVKATLDVYETGAYRDKQNGRDFNLFISGDGAQMVDPSPELFLTKHSKGVRNFAGYKIPEVDALVEDQGKQLDQVKRRELIGKLERKLFEVLAEIPVGHAQTLTGVQNSVKNWRPHDGRWTYAKHQDTWLSE